MVHSVSAACGNPGGNSCRPWPVCSRTPDTLLKGKRRNSKPQRSRCMSFAHDEAPIETLPDRG